MLPFDKVALFSLDSRLSILKNIVLKKFMIRTMNSANHVIFISEYARLSVVKLLRLKSDSVIYHGIASNFTPSSTISDNSILYVSRFETYKNHLNLIKAYNLLSEELKEKHSLILVGEGVEPALSLCNKYIESNNLEDKVKILGKVEYNLLPDLYRQCQLFVFPSSCENCPNILLEAIGCGAAIAASKTSPMPEFGKKAALYFDETDVQSINKVIIKVLENQNLRNQLVVKSIDLRGDYTWQNTAYLTWKCLINIGNTDVQK